MLRTSIQRPTSARSGFTILEALIVIVLLGIIGVMAVPPIGRAMTSTRADRAAMTVAGDVQAAFSLAARTRKPVTLFVDSVNKRIEIRERATSTVLQTRPYGLTESEFGLTRLAPNVPNIAIFPNGLASSSFTIYAFANKAHRAVRVRRTGHIKVTIP